MKKHYNLKQFEKHISNDGFNKKLKSVRFESVNALITGLNPSSCKGELAKRIAFVSANLIDLVGQYNNIIKDEENNGL